MGLASLVGAGYIIWVFWAFSCWISLIRGPRTSLMISLMSCDPTGGIDIEKLDARRVGWLWLNKAESAFFLWVSRMRGRASRCQRDVTLDAVGKECIRVSTTAPKVWRDRTKEEEGNLVQAQQKYQPHAKPAPR